MSHKPFLTLKAYAKINRTLIIGPRRPDGYHDLETIFQEIDLHDTLKFFHSDTLSMLVKNAHLPVTKDNLVLKALTLLQEKLRKKTGLRVELDKKIPIGAGLGGGSSDAAAALIGGWRLWTGKKIKQGSKVPLVLDSIAKKCGADVPFFLRGGIASATGIGEKLRPLKPAPSQWLILVYPRVHISTPKAYQLLDESRSQNGYQSDPKIQKNKKNVSFNSFESVIYPAYPDVNKASIELKKIGCKDVLMSGSGSSVFGFVSSKSAGQNIFLQLRNKKWDIFLTKTK